MPHFGQTRTSNDLSRSIVAALQAKFFRDQLFCVENERRASKLRFCIIRHSFQRTLPIAKAFQAIRVRRQKAIWSEQAPLNNVNKFMKVHVFVFGLCWLQKNGVDVSNAIRVTKTGKLGVAPATDQL